jgi:glucokinase
MPADHVIGIDLGGTKLLGGVVDPALEVHHRAYRASRGLDAGQLLDTVVEAVEELRAATDREIAGVGFGIPCLIDQDRGVAVVAVNLPIADVPFRDLMSERLGLPVWIDNDANTAMLAEHRHGAARGTRNAILLTVGTGVGGGIIIERELYRGSLGAGAELGHTVIDIDGPPCQGACPNHGCLETMASGTALGREALRVAQEQPDSALGRALAAEGTVAGTLVTELAHDGDEVAREVLALIGTRLGVGIANFVNVFNPDVVVVGGGVIAAGEMLLEPARRTVAERALPWLRDTVSIVPAQLGVEAGMLGAATLAMEGIQRTPA